MKKILLATLIVLSIVLSSVPTLAVFSSDTYYEKQTNLQRIGYDAAWSAGLDGTGVRIAVIDSGIYSEHEDISTSNLIPGINILDRSTDIVDTSGHGTFITGMLVAARNNGIGISGMVDKATLVPLKCFSSRQQTDSSYIVSAIYIAVDEYKCDVINLSLGIAQNIPALVQAVKYAADNGVIIVASVGNTGGTSLMYPATYENTIGVGSVSDSNVSSYFSQRNTSVFVVAPGENIVSTGINSDESYMVGSGTSFSAVHVTALAAIAKQHSKLIDCEKFKELLISSSVDLGSKGYDTTYGWGLINVPEFVNQLLKNKISFSDISGHWAEKYVYQCANNGLFNGVGNEMFMPNASMSRAMAATALYRLDNSPYTANDAAKFMDVKSDAWYAESVNWASENLIVSGIGNAQFSPDRSISREELAVMLYRYAQYKGLDLNNSGETSFKDSDEISLWAKKAVSWVADKGIVSGRSDGTFDPNSQASRAEVAAMLMRFTEIYG